MAMTFAAICYCVQAIVNISVPIVTPIIVLMIMMEWQCSEKTELVRKFKDWYLVRIEGTNLILLW